MSESHPSSSGTTESTSSHIGTGTGMPRTQRKRKVPLKIQESVDDETVFEKQDTAHNVSTSNLQFSEVMSATVPEKIDDGSPPLYPSEIKSFKRLREEPLLAEPHNIQTDFAPPDMNFTMVHSNAVHYSDTMPFTEMPGDFTERTSQAQQTEKKKRRVKNQSGTACRPCEVGKRKCDGARPCRRCARIGKKERCVDGKAALRKKQRRGDVPQANSSSAANSPPANSPQPPHFPPAHPRMGGYVHPLMHQHVHPHAYTEAAPLHPEYYHQSVMPPMYFDNLPPTHYRHGEYASSLAADNRLSNF